MTSSDNKIINLLYVEENQDGTTGGSHRSLLDIISQLDRDCFRVTVMFYENNDLIEQFDTAGCKVIVYNKRRPVSVVKEKASAIGKIWFFFIKFFCVMYNNIATSFIPLVYFIYFIYSKRIDIVHLNNSVFTFFEWIIASKVTRRKIIAHQHSHFKDISPLLKYHHRYFDFILGVSDFTRSYLADNNVDLTNYKTFYNRLDIPSFKKRVTKTSRQMRKELSIEGDAPVIGIVGNLQPWKGQFIVTQATELLKDKYPRLKCLLIGGWAEENKNYVDRIQSYCEEEGLSDSVIITGHRNDIPDLLTALDIFIHASLDPEPFGMVILEAMASHKPIIASNEGGPVEILENGKSGFLVPPGDPQKLAESIDTLLSNDALRKNLGNSAYTRLLKYFSSSDMPFLENLYRNLVGKVS